jgi:hypothetical protein
MVVKVRRQLRQKAFSHDFITRKTNRRLRKAMRKLSDENFDFLTPLQN